MDDDRYYTAEEARNMLGMPKTTFYEQVNAGNIPYTIDKGRRRGKKFPKAAIHIHAQLLTKGQDHRTFERATNSDLWTAIEYDRELYGDDDIISYKRALEWKARNDEIFMMMKDGGELSGTATLIPLEEGTIQALLMDKIRERNIPDWAIKKWTDSNLSVYIPTISIFPTGNKVIDRGRGRSLICYTLRWGLSLNKQYDIKNWYAIGATPEGKKLLDDLGFAYIEGTREGYILNDMEEVIPLIKEMLKRDDDDYHWSIPMSQKKDKGAIA